VEVVEVMEPVLPGANYDGDDDDDQTAEMSVEDDDEEAEEEKGRGVDLRDAKPKDNTPVTTLEMTTTKSRSVTPSESAKSKEQQQKKVNQLQLSFFFHKTRKQDTTTSPPVKKKTSPSSQEARASKSTSPPSAAIISPVEVVTASAKHDDMDAHVVTNPTETHNENPVILPSKEEENPVPDISSPSSAKDSKPDEAIPATIVLDFDGNDDPQIKATTPKACKSIATAETEATPSEQGTATTPGGPRTMPEAEHVACLAPSEEKPEQAKDLDDERKALLKKHADMRNRCLQRSEELVEIVREGLEEEQFEMPGLETTDISSDEEFPEGVVSNMARIIEGSPLPLSKLTAQVCLKLKECHHREWSEEAISTKIKLLAERKAYLDNAATFRNDVLAKYEDSSVDRMWRWELGIVDVLPSTILTKIRKARSARRKLLSHFMANQKLLKSIEEADTVIRDMNSDKLDIVIAKVGGDEEKVLKFERESEKKRLEQLARKKKDEEIEARKREKERKKEELEKKRLEKEREKQELAEARDAEKRQKMEERERHHQEKKQKEEQKKELLNKQKACLMSFFAAPKEPKVASETSRTTKEPDTVKKHVASEASAFDVDHFRSLINVPTSCDPGRSLFPSLSTKAIQSRKRRTRRVPVSVYVTVVPDSPTFDEQPFAEQKTIHVPNKYRFLSFHEDYRPPYHGTWSKRSKVITGRTPFAKDTKYLDYDYDSEAEWEEGDDEIGEDVEDDTKDQEDEEEEAKMYDYDDGFCVADDQYLDIDEGVDEETKALYKKKLQRGDDGFIANRVCIISPANGGVPVREDFLPDLVEGYENEEALEFLRTHTGKRLSQDLLWLDAFAPDNIDETEPSPACETPPQSTQQGSKDDHTVEEMRMLATFAHHCTLNSKEKLIEELRNANPNAFTSRAKVTRKLDSIAEKKKHPSGTGVYWEVHKEVLEGLQLDGVLAKKLDYEDTVKTSKPVSKKRKKTESSSETSEVTPASGKNAAGVEKPLAKSKKRKSVDSLSPSPQGTVQSTQKSKEIKAGTIPTAKKVVPNKNLGSTSVLLNFLQPRKKVKVEPIEPATS